MKGKRACIILGALIALAMILTSCGDGTTTTAPATTTAPKTTAPATTPAPAATTTAPATTTAVETHWWDKYGEPQYGGTITVPVTSLDFTFDPYNWMGAMAWNFWYESLWFPDWTLDRAEFSFFRDWTPDKYWKGLMAEDWEWTDPQTLTVQIKEGIHWQDKEPVNGREFVAEDIVYHFDRMLGTGSGFTEGSPYFAGRLNILDGVTASDDHTVVFHFNSTSTVVNSWAIIGEPMLQNFEAREAVELYGDLKEWTTAVGTGPFMLTDYQAGTSMTMSRNPNYWGYDERHPENQLPYADEVKLLCIPDLSTRISALKTGRLDRVEQISWQQAQTLAESYPDLQMAMNAQPGELLQMRVDTAPFDDINVRKALQMAVNLQDIAANYYGGTVDWKPVGVINPDYEGYAIPYDEWPADLQAEYAFDTTTAKQLLSDAGFPDGFDTNVVAASDDDMDLLQILQSYFKDINVNMEIRVMDPTSWRTFVQAAKHDQMSMSGLSDNMPPMMAATMWTNAEKNNGCRNNDARYEEIIKELASAGSVEEAQELLREADMIYLRSHWAVTTFSIANYVIWQPTLKGYSGEKLLWGTGPHYARWWKTE